MALDQAITARSRILNEGSGVKEGLPEVSDVENPHSTFGGEDTSATFGIDLILEMCRNTLGKAPLDVRNNVERTIMANLDATLYSSC